MKLRLLVTEYCPRKCPGCCNKDWDLKSLPVCKDFSGYSEVLITGGEPLSLPINTLVDIFKAVKVQNPTAKIILYTADSSKHRTIWDLLNTWLDGITLTLHEQKDVFLVYDFVNWVNTFELPKGVSLRMNIFKGIEYSYLNLSKWRVKANMEWIKNCPLPKDEVFMRYKQ